MFLVIVKSTCYFYLMAYSLLSVFSLLICIEDIDHQSIVCPRLGTHIKQSIKSLFTPIRPDILDGLVNVLIQLDKIYLSILVFSGILVLSSFSIYLFYQIFTKMPQKLNKLALFLAKITFSLLFVCWMLIYVQFFFTIYLIIRSGIGLNKFIEILQMIYSNPDRYEEYQQSFNQFVQQRQEEIVDYYF